mmetsp:Transcript_50583/g.120269  ORF Transcript_50583/g.120269 Transcript_50583/m.120269 type:complete len:233 (-) Transcript_50583:228-926(-)
MSSSITWRVLALTLPHSVSARERVDSLLLIARQAERCNSAKGRRSCPSSLRLLSPVAVKLLQLLLKDRRPPFTSDGDAHACTNCPGGRGVIRSAVASLSRPLNFETCALNSSMIRPKVFISLSKAACKPSSASSSPLSSSTGRSDHMEALRWHNSKAAAWRRAVRRNSCIISLRSCAALCIVSCGRLWKLASCAAAAEVDDRRSRSCLLAGLCRNSPLLGLLGAELVPPKIT